MEKKLKNIDIEVEQTLKLLDSPERVVFSDSFSFKTEQLLVNQKNGSRILSIQLKPVFLSLLFVLNLFVISEVITNEFSETRIDNLDVLADEYQILESYDYLLIVE